MTTPQRLLSELAANSTTKRLQIEVNDENGAIILTGRAKTFHQKQIAQSIALRIISPNVVICNKIVVE